MLGDLQSLRYEIEILAKASSPEIRATLCTLILGKLSGISQGARETEDAISAAKDKIVGLMRYSSDGTVYGS